MQIPDIRLNMLRIMYITSHDLNIAVEKILFDANGDRFRPSQEM